MKKNVLSTAVAGLILTGSLLTSVAAHATTTVLAPFDAAGNVAYGLTHATTGNYVDEFLFAISPETVGHASGTSVVGATWMLPAPADNYSISSILFFQVNPDSSHTDLTTTYNAGTMRFWTTELLTAGTYGFTVTGATTLANTGGSYAGNLNVVTMPVPEPSTYLMMVVGVGLLGLAGRRKANDKLG
ncbi:MAG: FxDxF family PEP-CTERM protein [Sphingomonadaceae bacterium]